MRQGITRVGLIGGLLLVASCDQTRAAQKVIDGILSGQTPRAVSQKIGGGFKNFWKSVQSTPRTVTGALQSVPSKANAIVKKIRQGLFDFLSSAAKISAPADGGNCSLVGLSADGDGYCYDEGDHSYLVFCSGGAPYALDCGTFAVGAVCGVNGDVIDCVTAPVTKADAVVVAEAASAADSSFPCDAVVETAAECEGAYLVFCQGGEVRELDCSTFVDSRGELATCGDLSGAVTCGWDE